jgi:RND family efflux transporter MFP subunit
MLVMWRIRGGPGWVLVFQMFAAAALPAAELETVPVVRAELPQVYRLDGVAEAISRGTVSAQTAGRVKAVNFDVDDLVSKGDVIVQIDDSRQQAGVRQAEANLEAAAAKRRDAEREYQRIRDVFAKDAVSKAEMDRVTAAFHQARANEQAAEAALHQAREELSYTQVMAPYDGVVTERLIEVGEAAQPGQRLMSGFSLEQMRVAVDVPQNLIESVRAERRAQAEIGDRWIAAEEITVFPVADPVSDTFKVRLRLPDEVENVFPGMYIKVGFVAGEQSQLVIPLSVMVARSEVIGVYVIDDEGRVQFRHIRPGSAAGPEHVTVLSGLSEGEQVAIDPVAAGIQLKAQRATRVHDE